MNCRSAIDIAASENLPVKVVEVDPYVTCLREVFSSASSGYLIERLHKEVDRMDTVSHIFALRQLVKSGGPIQAFTEAIHGCYIRREVKSLEGKETKGAEGKDAKSAEGKDAKVAEDKVPMPAEGYDMKAAQGNDTKVAAAKDTKGSGEGHLTRVKETLVELPLSVFVRAEAALTLAKCKVVHSTHPCFTLIDIFYAGQNEKGASLDSDKNEWLGRSALIEALTSIFTDPISKMPFRGQFDNESLTFFRNILLVSLASIQSRKGPTPLEVIEHIIYFFDNVDTGPIQDTTSNYFELDGGHYKAVLLYCLSKMKFSPKMKNDVLLRKIIDSAGFELDNDQAAAWTKYRLNKTRSPNLPGRGCLSANAINCIAEMECQELIVGASQGNYDVDRLNKTIDFEDYFRDFSNVSTKITPPTVRAAALEGYIRVLWCKQIISNYKENAAANYACTAINAVCDVITYDDNASVRHDAALSLLFTIQYRPPRVAAACLSFGEYLLSLDQNDPRAYASIYSLGKLFKNHKGVMTATPKSPEFQKCLQRLYGLILCGPSDQSVRGVLLSAWLYCYGSSSPLTNDPSISSLNDDSAIPESLLSECRQYHTVNTSELSAKVDKVYLRNFLQLVYQPL